MENGKKLLPVDKTWPIRPVLEHPPIRPETDRYRKMEVVMDSETVADALQRLKQIEKPLGSMRDVRLALHHGAVEIYGVDLPPMEGTFM